MSAKNRPVSKPMSQQFAENYDRIFGRSVVEKPELIAAQNKKNSLLRARVDAMPIGEDLRPKDPIKLGMSPSAEVINIDCTHPDPVMVEYTIRQLKNQSEGLRNILHHDKEQWEGFIAEDKEDE
jgi:hypothetical protein